MSWPADGQPRFVASAIKGGDSSQARHEATGYVLDRAYCHRPVVYVSANTERDARAKAETVAAILEAGGVWPPPKLTGAERSELARRASRARRAKR